MHHPFQKSVFYNGRALVGILKKGVITDPSQRQ